MSLSPTHDNISRVNQDADIAAGSFMLVPKFMTDALTFSNLVNSVLVYEENTSHVFFFRKNYFHDWSMKTFTHR